MKNNFEDIKPPCGVTKLQPAFYCIYVKSLDSSSLNADDFYIAETFNLDYEDYEDIMVEKYNAFIDGCGWICFKTAAKARKAVKEFIEPHYIMAKLVYDNQNNN